MSSFIHESSIVDDGAFIGDGSKVWHFCHIMSGARIGNSCILGQNVFIGRDVVVGDNVKIQNNVSIYTGVVIEDDVFIGPSVAFTNVLTPRAFVERKDEFLKTIVKKGATIGANATIICGNTIANYAMIGAGSVLPRSVKVIDYGLYIGNPARLVGYVCKCGNRLEFTDNEALCRRCGIRYKKKGESIYEVY